MASASPTTSASNLSDVQIQSLGRAAQITAGVLMLLAAAKVVTSVLTITTATLVALLGIVEGGLCVLLALILLKIVTDLRFAREVPQLGNVHLLNALDSWQDFCKFLIGFAVVAFLAAMLRFAA